MRIKTTLIGILLLFLPLISVGQITVDAQIKIDDVGDGWVSKVNMALDVIHQYDPYTYKQVIQYCDHISFWLGGYSTTQYPSSIIIAVNDIKLGSVNNLACIIVHETVHLKIYNKGINMSGNHEELVAYKIEENFANKIPNIEWWILDHINKQIKLYTALTNDK